MKKLLFPSILVCVTTICAFAQVTYHLSKKDSAIVEEIKRRYEFERQFILRQDSIALNKFYPDDFVVTNQFNQFINKKTVLERVKANIIKYSSYERYFDYFKVYGNTVFVVGTEVILPTTDAARPDAGQTGHRRFTEVWMKRDNEWMKVLRHTNTYVPQ